MHVSIKRIDLDNILNLIYRPDGRKKKLKSVNFQEFYCLCRVFDSIDVHKKQFLTRYDTIELVITEPDYISRHI